MGMGLSWNGLDDRRNTSKNQAPFHEWLYDKRMHSLRISNALEEAKIQSSKSMINIHSKSKDRMVSP